MTDLDIIDLSLRFIEQKTQVSTGSGMWKPAVGFCVIL